MNTVTPGATNRNISKKISRKKKTVRIIALCLAVLIIAGAAYIFVNARNNSSENVTAQRTTKVIKGQLVDSIAGSAPIVSSNRSELSPKVTATLEKINCKEGDQVKAGDVLFVLDNTDAMLDIENAKNSIAQLQLTLDSTAKSVGGLLVSAPYSGQITDIKVKEGDTINKAGALFTITDMDNLTVTLPFNGTAAQNITVGQSADVFLQDLMLSVSGEVAYKSSSPYTTASGGKLYNVEITIKNPGALSEGMKATAEITVDGENLSSVESGTLSYVNTTVIKSDAGGTIKNLNVRENELVTAGDILAEMENDELILTSQTNDIKMENLQSQLQIKQKQLLYYIITAPFDGTITKMGSAIEGDTVKQGEVLAIVSDMGHLEFEVSIDELDISQLMVGQSVNITAEALEDTSVTPLTGKVTRIAMEGSSSNGVTTYPVTITVDDDCADKLKTGMNIDAEIFISDKQDVIMVPLEAVIDIGNRSFVYVKGEAGQSGTDGQNSTNSAGGEANLSRMPLNGNTSGAAFRANMGNTSGQAISGGKPQGNGQKMSGQGASVGQKAASAQAGNVQGAFAKMAQGANSDSYYDGAYLVEVETGISNSSYMEIISGLVEGQEIVLPKASTSTNSTGSSNQKNQGGMMMPFGGGSGGGNIRMGGGF